MRGLQIAGFMPYDDGMSERIAEAQCSTPAFFVWGTADELVPAPRSKQLAAAFNAASIQSYEHGGAHMVRCLCSPEFNVWVERSSNLSLSYFYLICGSLCSLMFRNGSLRPSFWV